MLTKRLPVRRSEAPRAVLCALRALAGLPVSVTADHVATATTILEDSDSLPLVNTLRALFGKSVSCARTESTLQFTVGPFVLDVYQLDSEDVGVTLAVDFGQEVSPATCEKAEHAMAMIGGEAALTLRTFFLSAKSAAGFIAGWND